jgi:hypothetical protein
MNHESVAAEKLALCWHVFWAFVCLLCAANYIAAMIEAYQFAIFPGLLGWHFKHAVWLALAQEFMALFGFLWHVYGSREHARKLCGR